MIRTVKAIADFVKFSVPRLIVFSRETQDGCDNNPDLPNLPFDKASLETTTDDLEKNYILAQKGDEVAKEAVKRLTSELISKLKKNMTYVNLMVGGDAEKIKKTMFHTSKEEVIVHHRDFDGKTSSSEKGVIELILEKIPGAKGYVFMYCQQDTAPVESDWLFLAAPTARKYVKTGLISGKGYWFRVIPVISKAEEALWTEPVYRFIP